MAAGHIRRTAICSTVLAEAWKRGKTAASLEINGGPPSMRGGLPIQRAGFAVYSPTPAGVITPESVDADAVRRGIYTRFDLSLGAGLSELKGRMFPLGHLGDSNDLTHFAMVAGAEIFLKLTGVQLADSGIEAAMGFFSSNRGGIQTLGLTGATEGCPRRPYPLKTRRQCVAVPGATTTSWSAFGESCGTSACASKPMTARAPRAPALPTTWLGTPAYRPNSNLDRLTPDGAHFASLPTLKLAAKDEIPGAPRVAHRAGRFVASADYRRGQLCTVGPLKSTYRSGKVQTTGVTSLGHKSFMFMGSDAGGERVAANAMTKTPAPETGEGGPLQQPNPVPDSSPSSAQKERRSVRGNHRQ